MVSSLLVDALTNPTVLVSDLYKSRDRTRSFPVQVSKYFSDIFATQDAFNEISVLDLQHPPESFKPHALVRFDSMVQDTSCPPEIYLSQSPKGECGGWGISSPEEGEQDSVDYSLLQECTVVWATSIPGRSRWLDGEASSSDQSAIKSVQSHKYPLPSTAHIGAQVKIYEPQLAESLRTTDLYSFVGVLTSEPRPASLDSTEHVPVPTIHVLFARPIPSTLVPRSFPDQSLLPDLEVAREKLVSWIADEGLSGDRLAAEFVLLSIIHKVQSRSPPLLPLSLTLSGYSHASNPTPKLVDVLSHLVPLCTVLPLSLDAINSTSFFPESKDEDLHSGRLQLPKGSLCMVSELPLNEGTVSERGLLNLKQVQDMINHQTLDYVFPFSRYSFETDINFIVLAAGKRSAFFTVRHLLPRILTLIHGEL
ncbi:hypothetical protein CC2G_005893 [Coprinopsis cinerea AmutBmut pab1-1]|nr:hypothetical protein CC2G_005893 [Coprinopsis cinerea AmutBmut pab1-1]